VALGWGLAMGMGTPNAERLTRARKRLSVEMKMKMEIGGCLLLVRPQRWVPLAFSI